MTPVLLSQDGTPPPPIGRGQVLEIHKAIVVDIDTQMIIAFENGEAVHKFECSTGKNNGTPRGDWPIRQKLRYNRALEIYGGGAIPYSLRLDIVINGRRRRIAIHQYPNVPRYPASHGCIRVNRGDAAELFGWAEVGIIVTVK